MDMSYIQTIGVLNVCKVEYSSHHFEQNGHFNIPTGQWKNTTGEHKTYFTVRMLDL